MQHIYHNGKIITMSESSTDNALRLAPEAVLTEDGIIKAAGTLSDITAMAGKDAVRTDLYGRCLMPSFIDPHGHIFLNGRFSSCCYLGECKSHRDIINTLRTFIRERKPGNGSAVIGYGYDHNFLEEQTHPDRRILDQVSTDLPILVLHVSLHTASANSMALDAGNINENTKDPEGGFIGRFKNSREPSGYLEETAAHILRNIFLKNDESDLSSIASGMQENYLKNGITTAQDGATDPTVLKGLKEIARSGKLQLDIVSYPMMSKGGVEMLHVNQDLCGKYKNRLRIGGYKIILDGSPQARSAWMSKPYQGGEKDYCGYPWHTDAEVLDFVSTALSEGRQVLAHCNGDAAGDQYLDAYEKALANTGAKGDLRPVMVHCQTARNDQLDRMAKLGMVATIFVGHVYYWGDVHVKNFGPERGSRVSPVNDALKRGITYTLHQDTPVTPPYMMHSIWCAVNRITRGGNHIGPEEKIGVYDAMKGITINAAYQYFEEHEKGTISPGKRADLVILDRSPLEVGPEELKDIRVCCTIKDGQTVYGDE